MIAIYDPATGVVSRITGDIDRFDATGMETIELTEEQVALAKGGTVFEIVSGKLVQAESQIMSNLRDERNLKLKASDELMWPDRLAKRTTEEVQALYDYRDGLRDLPANVIDAKNPEWPEPPEWADISR